MIDILDPARDRDRIDALLHAGDHRLVDAWATARPELTALAQFTGEEVPDSAQLDSWSRYVVYPWRRTVVRVPVDPLLHRLRTARNRFLITDDEQAAWSSAQLAVAGLSVGASVVQVAALTGARRFHLADPDTLGPTNLNRLAGSVCDLGLAKTTLAARRLLEADPYAEIATWDRGYQVDRSAEFLRGRDGRPVDVVIEEMDDLAMKVAVRSHVRTARIPLIMVTDDGDNVIIDVERHDLDRDYPPFHGAAGEIAEYDLEALRDPANRVRVACAIVGADVAPRVAEALAHVGQTIPSWPQLGTAASLAGVVGAFAARTIVCGGDLPSGRYRVAIDDALTAHTAHTGPAHAAA
ncbi:ThiF family adenylyltransferase [Gordonia sp. DT30]|uniref:ThiF family adenylyltransferase n=1 Tax=Gordonia sp. DT30 TaxID=3416546 RepID=UPI003CEBA6C0